MILHDILDPVVERWDCQWDGYALNRDAEEVATPTGKRVGIDAFILTLEGDQGALELGAEFLHLIIKGEIMKFNSFEMTKQALECWGCKLKEHPERRRFEVVIGEDETPINVHIDSFLIEQQSTAGIGACAKLLRMTMIRLFRTEMPEEVPGPANPPRPDQRIDVG